MKFLPGQDANLGEDEMPTNIPDSVIDVSGVCCPLPLIELAKAVNKLTPGKILSITGNDPIFEPSVRNFCESNGHTLLEVTENKPNGVTILLRVEG